MAADDLEGVDEDLDRLYGLALDEFTAARNELAKRLRKEGRRGEADAVKTLRKPSVAAWAVNRLARAQRDQLEALLHAADDVRKAHRGGPEEVRAAMRAERQALDTLVRAARRELETAGQGASEATLARVRATLEAGAADPDRRADLVRGRLVEELEPGGFELLAGLTLPPRGAAAAGRGTPARDAAADRAERRRRIAEAREELAAARARMRELQRAAAAAQREADRAQAEAEKAEAAVARAEEKLADAERAG